MALFPEVLTAPEEARAEAERLGPFTPRLAVDWLRNSPEALHRRIEGALSFVDVSGFTALTERLASKGKAGAEEVSDLVADCFAQLLDTAWEYGADMLKWGGDAALLFFPEPHSAERACRAAWGMCRLMERAGTLRTSVGTVTLRVSIGVHRGPVDFFLLGHRHRELVVTGPSASAVARMEAAAEAGEVVVSPPTAAALPADLRGAAKGAGILLDGPPAAAPAGPVDPPGPSELALGLLFPPPTRAHLLAGGETCEHRQAAVAFIEFSGVDELIACEGPEAVLGSLEHVVVVAQEAAHHEGANFHGTDVAADGGKLLVLGGIPVVRGNDEERVLRCALSIVEAGGDRLRLRAGLNTGRVFMHESGPAYRRIHSFAGDAVNLAARVMGHATHGQVLATAELLARTRSRFDAVALEPFLVKGKSEPVEALAVGGVVHGEEIAAPQRNELVGRHAELAALVGHAARAAHGSGAVVEVVAEAGMGKTTLLAAAQARWPLQSFRLLSEEYGRSTPYLPFRWLLRAALGLGEDGSSEETEARLRSVVAEQAPNLGPWLPLVGDVLGLTLPATPEVEQLDARFVRARLEETVVDLLGALVRSPSAFVFEDGHEIDDASHDLLARLAAAASSRPWMVVVTLRPYGRRLPEELVHDVVTLSPLDSDAALDLVGSVSDEVALSAQDRRLLVERAGGNPLFLQELALATRRAGSVEDLPDRIEALLAAKVDRLEPADRQVLRAAAVLGIRFDPVMVGDLMDDSGRDEPLGSDLWRRLAEYVQDEGGGHKRFVHALVRDAAYEGLSYRRRRHLHGRAADAIAARSRLPGENADLLSLHSLHAERYEDAWHFGCLAGQHARSLHANGDAVTFFTRAVQAARHLPAMTADQVAPVAEALGDVAEMAGRFDVAREGYDRARRVRPTGVDRARLLRKTGVLFERAGRYPEALRCYSRARRMVVGAPGDGADDPAAMGEASELAVAYAGVRYRQGHLAQCVHWTEVAIDEARSSVDRSVLAHALYLGDLARVWRSEAAGSGFAQALAIYEELGDLVGQANVLNNMGIAAQLRGDWTEMLDFSERSRQARHRAGDAVGVATQEYNIAEALSAQGRYPQARELYDSARTAWRAARYRVGVALVTANSGRMEVRAGEVERGLAMLEEGCAELQAMGAQALVAEVTTWLADARVLCASPDVALRTAQETFDLVSSSELADTLRAWGHRLLGLALFRNGDRHGARVELDRAAAEAQVRDQRYELAMALATRCTLGLGGDAQTEDDRRRARALMEDLGIVDTPVTSLTDRWPGRSSD